ncbi:MAG TPA: cyclic nucleotide-binding and patatin-like phospholipase domain-containing protein [Herpetosiphonaceae bacterium]|nr:cyclic nucleotide-binding and patatin-like phospholipase domain-containing protein [Herpetosiphonaceae bacterium]
MEETLAQPALQNLVAHVRGLSLFKELDQRMLDQFTVVRLTRGATLFREGEPGDAMYVVLEGRLQVTIRQAGGGTQVLEDLEPGASVGEMALLTGRARSATVTALEDATLARLSHAMFDRITTDDPDALLVFARAILPRFQMTQLVGILGKLFGNLTREAVNDLRTEFQWQHLASGETLFRQDDPSDSLYIVVNGRLRVILEQPDGTRRTLNEISRGEVVGEVGLLIGEPRTATVQAVRDTDVVRLEQASFDHLLERYPQAAMQIARQVVRRTRRSAQVSSFRASTVSALAVVPAGDDVPLAAFARQLAGALGVYGPVLLLDSAQLDRMVGKVGTAHLSPDHPTSFALSDWLSQQESQYSYIIYQADPSWSEWTQRCVRQADRVLIVGEGGADPAPGPIEVELRRMYASIVQELVLIHPASLTRPSGTRAWLDQRSVVNHHHVRLEVDADVARLTRRLTGRALGLVLGGGGARGLAHIGVMRALAEEGIEVDLVGGTSMGAFAGAAYALGWQPDAIANVARTFGSRKSFADYTVPIVSFFASDKLNRVLQSTFEDVYVEDLWRPFYCVSSNLTQARPVVHRQGLLWRVVRASTSLPAIFTPVLDENGDLLVDGAMMNNLPIDIMRDLSEGGPIIAVNVSLEREQQRGYQFGLSLSGWQVLKSRLNPWGTPMNVPTLFANIMRSMEISDVYERRAKRQLADVFISPAVDGFSILDFSAYEKIIDAGYRAAKASIAAWRGPGTDGREVPARPST